MKKLQVKQPSKSKKFTTSLTRQESDPTSPFIKENPRYDTLMRSESDEEREQHVSKTKLERQLNRNFQMIYNVKRFKQMMTT